MAERGHAEPADGQRVGRTDRFRRRSPTWTAFDQLDTLVRVTTVQGWVYLAVLFAVGAGAIAFAFLYQVPTKVNGEGLLLTERDALVRVRATGDRAARRPRRPGSGTGSMPETSIGRIAQEELEDRIQRGPRRSWPTCAARTGS